MRESMKGRISTASEQEARALLLEIDCEIDLNESQNFNISPLLLADYSVKGEWKRK